jgi:hypothetical protein
LRHHERERLAGRGAQVGHHVGRLNVQRGRLHGHQHEIGSLDPLAGQGQRAGRAIDDNQIGRLGLRAHLVEGRTELAARGHQLRLAGGPRRVGPEPMPAHEALLWVEVDDRDPAQVQAGLY